MLQTWVMKTAGKQKHLACGVVGWLVVFYLWGCFTVIKVAFYLYNLLQRTTKSLGIHQTFQPLPLLQDVPWADRFNRYLWTPKPMKNEGFSSPNNMGETTPKSEGTVRSHVFWGPSCTESKDDWTDSPGQTQELKKSRKCHVELNKIRR